MTQYTLASFAKFLADAAEKSDADGLKEACKMIEDEAKRVIGTYDYGWQELAEATKKDRVAKGYSENEPLLRSGELRDSIETTILSEGRLGEIGTNNPVAPFMEYGTASIPARSFLAAAAAHMEDEIAERFQDRFMILWDTGRAAPKIPLV